MFRKILSLSALALIAPTLVGYAVADDWVPPDFRSEVHFFEEIIGNGGYESATALGNEQVVEGHTTFITMAMTPPKTFNIEGFVSCDYGVFGIRFGVPPSFQRAFVECRVGEHVYATPDGYPPPSSSSSMSPTGALYPVTDPQGRTWVTEEFAYATTRVTASGEVQDVTAYVWRVPVSGDALTTGSGESYNFAMKLPRARLVELGTDTVRVHPSVALFN